jgi:hypothetical protein
MHQAIAILDLLYEQFKQLDFYWGCQSLRTLISWQEFLLAVPLKLSEYPGHDVWDDEHGQQPARYQQGAHQHN